MPPRLVFFLQTGFDPLPHGVQAGRAHIHKVVNGDKLFLVRTITRRSKSAIRSLSPASWNISEKECAFADGISGFRQREGADGQNQPRAVIEDEPAFFITAQFAVGAGGTLAILRPRNILFAVKSGVKRCTGGSQNPRQTRGRSARDGTTSRRSNSKRQ